MRAALHAEWTKMRTTPGTGWFLIAVVVLTVAVGRFVASAVPFPADPVKTALTGVTLGQAVVAVLAVTAVGGEYGTGMILVSLTAVPRRTVLLAAKTLVLLAAVTVAAVPAVAGSVFAVSRPTVGSVLYLDLIALLAIGVAVAVRDQATAIGTVLGLLYLFPILAAAVPDRHWQRHLQQIGPMSAGLEIQAGTGLKQLPIGPWTGLGVLALWAFAALLTGGVLLRYRDSG